MDVTLSDRSSRPSSAAAVESEFAEFPFMGLPVIITDERHLSPRDLRIDWDARVVYMSPAFAAECRAGMVKLAAEAH